MAAERRVAAARSAAGPSRRRLSRQSIVERIAVAAEAAPIGSVWADADTGSLYEVAGHGLPVGDVSTVEDIMVLYVDPLDRRASFIRGVTSFVARFVRRR
jgi:hypothetical protein